MPTRTADSHDETHKAHIMSFDDAFAQLVHSWLQHEEMKHRGASIPELFDARMALDKARYQAAIHSHR